MALMSRISQNMIYGQNMKRLSSLQAQLDKTQQHLSGNTRILSPADDPVAAARALDLKQGQSMNTQFASNRGNTKDALKLQESTLNSVEDALQRAHTRLVQAGDGAYDEEQLQVLAEELRAIRDEVAGYANTRDAYGSYIFSGHRVGTEPFDMSATGQVTYRGDDGQLMMRVDADRLMAASNSGREIFMGIKGMSASTVALSNADPAAPSSSLTRHALMIDVNIMDESKLPVPPDPAHTYEVRFAGKSPAATYTLWRDNVQVDTSGNPLAVTYPYTGDEKNRMEVEMDGVRFSVAGEVDDGDIVTIEPGEPSRSDIFAYFNEAIDLLENTSIEVDGGSTNLALGLKALLGNFATGLDQVLTARGSTGTRLKELDVLDLGGTDKGLLYTESISELEDLDYYQAISDLYIQQTTLQAAQKTFMLTRDLSLFNLM